MTTLRTAATIALAPAIPFPQRMIVACFYHWYTAGLYASPVILVGGWLFFASKRDRRRDKRDGGGPPAPSAPPQALSN